MDLRVKIFNDLLSNFDIKFYLQYQYNYQGMVLMTEIEYFLKLNNHFFQYTADD